jgi:hypothetical protein
MSHNLLGFHGLFYRDGFTFFLTHNSIALVRERTIPTERLTLVGEFSTNFYG